MDTLVALSLSLVAVTVHREGAIYRYTGLLPVRKGYTEAVWWELPPTTDPATIRISLLGSSSATITQTRVEKLSPIQRPDPPEVKVLRQRIDSLEGLLTRLNNRLALLQLQESTLSQNMRLGGEESPTHPEEVEKYLLLLERHLPRLQEEQALVRKRLTALQETLKHWQTLYQNYQSARLQQRAVLWITCWSSRPENVLLRVELSGPKAGWELRYRLRAVPTEGWLYLQRWASVTNASGEDWKNVQLTLSTGQPQISGELPPFRPWYVDLQPPIPWSEESLRAKALLHVESAEEKRGAPEEGPSSPPPPPLPKAQDQILSRTYELGTQTLPAASTPVQFFLSTDTLPALFRFFINAAASDKAYLRAAIPLEALRLWEKAQAVLEVEGQEVGQIPWPPYIEEDTTWISLGLTERVSLQRLCVQDHRESKAISNKTVHRMRYRLQLVSSYPQPISVTLWDRIPVSRTSEIQVELEEDGGARLEADSGRLRWDITLRPNETWQRHYTFTLKYPKGKRVWGL
ncbi:MAG: DUF4139 domain-containing protein [Bacteroidia bacterium]|nr:DUF4139 domain-containing protein [Bacteroidia bacterium]MDW8088669.1 DUF4139 domain-containing protein [Bacteroidia bacterium]